MMMISVIRKGLNIRFHILEGLNETCFKSFLYVWNTCINRNRGTADCPQRTNNDKSYQWGGMQCRRITIKIHNPFKTSMKGSCPCVLKQILAPSPYDTPLCWHTISVASTLERVSCIANSFMRRLILSEAGWFLKKADNVKHKEAWTLLSSHWGPEKCPLKTDKSRQRYRAGICLTYSCF